MYVSLMPPADEFVCLFEELWIEAHRLNLLLSLLWHVTLGVPLSHLFELFVIIDTAKDNIEPSIERIPMQMSDHAPSTVTIRVAYLEG